ncbi:MAG: glucosyl-3-phosphoglycerate synthase [Anaerolineales bacterium]|nr:glucosyl-3-phosphoglycerate synthase [Anaerolineales bacterium]
MGNRLTRSRPHICRLLAPVSNLREARLLLPLAEMIVKARQGQLIILQVVTVPEGEALSESAGDASQLREELAALLPGLLSAPAHTRTLVRPAGEVWNGVWEMVAQEKIDILLLAWGNPEFPETAVMEMKDPRLAAPPCDLVVVYPRREVAAGASWQPVRRVLLPVRGGPYGGFSLRVANALAGATGAAITILHATGGDQRLAEEALLDDYGPALHGLHHIQRSLVVVKDVPGAILEEAPQHQALVMGAPVLRVYQDGWGGPILDSVLSRSDITTIVVKSKSLAEPTPQDELTAGVQVETPGIISGKFRYRGDRPVAVVVDEWFAENTFHSREFADLERLVALKQEQGLTISLGLPALNEAATVGAVISSVKSALMDEVPLLDEIVLIDSGSVDYTREIAADLGIPVYVHHEILPQYGAYNGKGEALWKSLYVLKGDILAWIDTDIKNIHPRFVYGILGPLLHDPSILYTKGFYRRPLKEGDKLVAGGGGRVTELTARPFINLFFPELSGIIQPLSGEYAGRRRALERMPFFSGYGVETGLLLDILEEFGLGAIAQVDLLERVHHNQPLPSLSKMSFAIMQVVFSHLQEQHKVNLLHDANMTMNLIRYGPSRYYLETEEIKERERPPMITLPEYRASRGVSEPEPGEGN